MTLVANFLVALVALLHLFFMYLEMFLWTKPYGRHVFGLSKELAESSAA
jgi:putative membrane protein